MERTYIKDIAPGMKRVSGFVENFRNKRTMAFIVIKDITGKLQVTVEKEKHPEMAEMLDSLTIQSVVTFEGEVLKNDYVKLGGIEMLPDTMSAVEKAEYINDGKARLERSKWMLSVIIPLLVMFSNMDMDSIQRVLNTPNFKDIVVNSLTVGGVATAISVIGGYLLARAVHRSGVKGKELFGMLFTIPMLVPSISLGMGLIMLLGNNVIITKLLGLEKGIYGMWGIVLGSVLYSLPVAYLMFSDILKYL